MTDIDLAAIRERYAAWQRISDAGNDDLGEGTVAMVLAGNDVPALLAEVECLTAERDEAVRVYKTMREGRDRWQAATQRERERIEAHVEPHRALVQAREAAEAERDGVREELARMAGDLDDACSERDRYRAAAVQIREARRRLSSRLIASAYLLDVPFTNAPDHSPWTGIKAALYALDAAVDAYTAPGVDTGTSEPRSAAHGDARPADGVVAAESDPLAEAIAAYFGGFVHEEGATYRHNDFAEGLIESLTDAGWNIDAIGHPNTWALPAEPGPEVTAVRGSDGVRWVRAVRNAPGWRRDRGGSITVSWQTMLRDAAPLTDATGETP